VLESRLTPTTLIVTTQADAVVDGDGKRSLREAITRANATDERDIIVLPAGVYSISDALGTAFEDGNASGDFDITRPLRIQGAGANSTVIDAANLDRVFDLLGKQIDVTFSDLTIRNGFAPDLPGGGIYTQGASLTLNRCVVQGNAAANGGGVYSISDAVTLNHSRVSDNVAAGSGGGIFALSSVTLNRSRVKDNRADEDGGGIHSGDGDVRLTQSVVSGNVAGRFGGGINADDDSNVTLTKCTVRTNTAGISGGGISVSAGLVTLTTSLVSDNVAKNDGGGILGNVTLDHSTVARNVAGDMGGGIAARGGQITLRNSLVATNVAKNGGGGIANTPLTGLVSLTASRVIGNVASDPTADGGGILVNVAPLTLSRSTVRGNRAGENGGGIYSHGQTSIDFSTVSENTAQFGGGIFADFNLALDRSALWGNRALVGGGLFLNAGTSTIANVTLSGNTASQGGGLFNNATVGLFHTTVTRNTAEFGGGVDNNIDGILKVKNTILAQNQATTGAAEGPDVYGTFTSLGRNLLGIVDGSSGFDASLRDQFGNSVTPLDPRLKPLADNGGPTLTHALRAGSPAIDAGDDDLGYPADQRGFDRYKDGDGDGTVSVDIGAFEK
jgi:predicted outer membrane repeat protein